MDRTDSFAFNRRLLLQMLQYICKESKQIKVGAGGYLLAWHRREKNRTTQIVCRVWLCWEHGVPPRFLSS